MLIEDDSLIETHPLFPLFTVLLESLSSEKLDHQLSKRISLELIRIRVDNLNDFQDKFIDSILKSATRNLLHQLGQNLQNLLTAEEAFRVLAAANEPFKRTRRRLPPIVENELTRWLTQNSKHPYMCEQEVTDFCERFEGIQRDQVRMFLTNARRRMSEGVRKRKKNEDK